MSTHAVKKPAFEALIVGVLVMTLVVLALGAPSSP